MEETSVETLNSREACAEAVARLVAAAEHKIALFSQNLEPLLYNHQALCDDISALARKNRHSSIRIIAQDTRSAADGHCLVHLAQKLSSSIQIRVPATQEIQHYSKSLLIIDDHSMVLIDNPERYEGSLIENNRLHVRTKLEFFDHAWDNSLPDTNTRRLHI
jgi:hypothetical protein